MRNLTELAPRAQDGLAGRLRGLGWSPGSGAKAARIVQGGVCPEVGTGAKVARKPHGMPFVQDLRHRPTAP